MSGAPEVEVLQQVVERKRDSEGGRKKSMSSSGGGGGSHRAVGRPSVTFTATNASLSQVSSSSVTPPMVSMENGGDQDVSMAHSDEGLSSSPREPLSSELGSQEAVSFASWYCLFHSRPRLIDCL